MHITTPSTQERSLRFPEGGVWSLRHPAQDRSSLAGRHTQPMPGDLTTDRVLDEAQVGLNKIAADIDELTNLLDDVVFRFPANGAARHGQADEWPPNAA